MRATRRVVPFAAAVAVSVAAVASAASGFNGVEGQQFSGQVGSVFLACSGSDPNFNCSGMPATMSGASVKWGDGVTVTSTATKDSCDTGAGHCVYSVNGSHTYAEEGSYQVTFTVPNPNGPPSNNPAHGSSTATIADAALTNATGTTATATEGASRVFDLGTFNDANPGAAAADFTASIDWGDGTAASGAVSANGSGGFSVSGIHTYTEPSTRTPFVHVGDDGGSTLAIQSSVKVVDAPLSDPVGATLTATQGVPKSFDLGSFHDGNPLATASDFSATIHWGDGAAPTTGTVSADVSGRFEVRASHTFAATGAKAVTVKVADADGASTSIADSVDVRRTHPPRTLTVTTTGTGGGTVTGPGIDCGGQGHTDCTESYADGRHLTLSAAADSGSIFRGFGGDCSGSTCSLTMGADHSVSATFGANPSPPNTKISKVKIDQATNSATFKFTSKGGAKAKASRGFQCALVKKRRARPRFKACESPKSYKHLKPHRYVFEVRAFSAAGKDPSPAKERFKIR